MQVFLDLSLSTLGVVLLLSAQTTENSFAARRARHGSFAPKTGMHGDTMRSDWMTDEERAASHAREKWLRIEAWAFGFFQAAIALIALRALLS